MARMPSPRRTWPAPYPSCLTSSAKDRSTEWPRFGDLEVLVPYAGSMCRAGCRKHWTLTARRTSCQAPPIFQARSGVGTFYNKRQWGSLTLGAVAVPTSHFADVVRGCIDGDGSIVTYVDRYNAFKKPSYFMLGCT